MKINNLQKLGGAFFAAVLLTTSYVATAADVVATTTTESAGTISDFGNDVITIRSETSPEPVRYSYSKSTTYVDEAGAPVSIETVKSGLPVTVHYVREGDRMLANRVVVHKRTTTTTAAPVVEERRTTTTTTTTK